MWDPAEGFETMVLPNGLTVHAMEWANRPWQIVRFIVHSGARQDAEGNEGLLHFVEHLVSENASLKQEEIERLFENSGGSVMLGATGFDSTEYGFRVPAEEKTLAEGLDVFGHMLLSASLKAGIDHNIRVVTQEFNRRFPARESYDMEIRRHQALHAGTWMERFVAPLGNPQSVSGFTQPCIQASYDAHYVPENMSIVTLGGMQTAIIERLIRESPLSCEKPGKRTALPTTTEEREILLPKENRVPLSASEFTGGRKMLNIGGYKSWGKLPGSISLAAVQIAADLYGSLLTKAVREDRGWTYHIGAFFHNRISCHELGFACSAFAPEALDEIEKIVEECVEQAANASEQFEAIRRNAIRKMLLLDPNGKQVCSGLVSDLETHHRRITLAEVVGACKAVTIDDIRRISAFLQPKRRWTLLIRP